MTLITHEKTPTEELEFGFTGENVFEDNEVISDAVFTFDTTPGTGLQDLGAVGDAVTAARKFGGGVLGQRYLVDGLVTTTGGANWSRPLGYPHDSIRVRRQIRFRFRKVGRGRRRADDRVKT